MSEQAKKLPPATVTIPGELWPAFRLWAVHQGYDLDVLDDKAGEHDRFALVQREPAVDMSHHNNAGPWL